MSLLEWISVVWAVSGILIFRELATSISRSNKVWGIVICGPIVWGIFFISTILMTAGIIPAQKSEFKYDKSTSI